MSLRYIIDGYNIIHHPKFTTRINKNIKDSRLLLLDLIKREKLTGSPRNTVIVVFDGYPAAQQAKDYNEIYSQLNVIFSRKETADEKIRKIVERIGNPHNVVLVSDDKELKFFIKSCGGSALSVEEFIIRKEKAQIKGEEDALKPELTYSQMHKINQELRKIWLK